MTTPKEDLTNRKFGRLFVLQQAEDYVSPKGKRYRRWLCECDCQDHNKCIILEHHLKNGHTISCGCFNKERVAEAMANRVYEHEQKKQNQYELRNGYGVMWSTNTNEEIYFDIDDMELILQHAWCINKRGYPCATIDGQTITLHKFLGYYRPDHHNRNKLDNRKENLVLCTTEENRQNASISIRNTSGFIGVYFNKKDKRWQASITISKQRKNLGSFMNKDDAVIARLRAEKEYFGDFAPQRHLFADYHIC